MRVAKGTQLRWEEEKERERERERERALLGTTVHSGGSRAAGKCRSAKKSFTTTLRAQTSSRHGVNC